MYGTNVNTMTEEKTKYLLDKKTEEVWFENRNYL